MMKKMRQSLQIIYLNNFVTYLKVGMIRPLAGNVGAFTNSVDVAYVAEAILEHSGFIVYLD